MDPVVNELRFVIFSEQEEFAQEMSTRLSTLRNVKIVGVSSEIANLVEDRCLSEPPEVSTHRFFREPIEHAN